MIKCSNHKENKQVNINVKWLFPEALLLSINQQMFTYVHCGPLWIIVFINVCTCKFSVSLPLKLVKHSAYCFFLPYLKLKGENWGRLRGLDISHWTKLIQKSCLFKSTSGPYVCLLYQCLLTLIHTIDANQLFIKLTADTVKQILRYSSMGALYVNFWSVFCACYIRACQGFFEPDTQIKYHRRPCAKTKKVEIKTKLC